MSAFHDENEIHSWYFEKIKENELILYTERRIINQQKCILYTERQNVI